MCQEKNEGKAPSCSLFPSRDAKFAVIPPDGGRCATEKATRHTEKCIFMLDTRIQRVFCCFVMSRRIVVHDVIHFGAVPNMGASGSQVFCGGILGTRVESDALQRTGLSDQLERSSQVGTESLLSPTNRNLTLISLLTDANSQLFRVKTLRYQARPYRPKKIHGVV